MIGWPPSPSGKFEGHKALYTYQNTGKRRGEGATPVERSCGGLWRGGKERHLLFTLLGKGLYYRPLEMWCPTHPSFAEELQLPQPKADSTLIVVSKLCVTSYTL